MFEIPLLSNPSLSGEVVGFYCLSETFTALSCTILSDLSRIFIGETLGKSLLFSEVFWFLDASCSEIVEGIWDYFWGIFERNFL